MSNKIFVAKHERGVLFDRWDFSRLLRPGEHKLYGFWARIFSKKQRSVTKFDTMKTKIEHPLLDTFVDALVREDEAIAVSLSDSQRALVWRDGRLAYILGPGRHAFWKTPYELKVETFDISESVRLRHAKLPAILQNAESAKFFDGVQVSDHEEVLLYRDGVLIERLREGLHVFWKGTGKIAWRAVDLREQVADVAGQEIMTADKVTLRVNLVVTFVVVDALRAVTASADYVQALYREAQLVLRAAVGTRPLDALLADKESVGSEVKSALVTRVEQLGVRVSSVGLRDIVLPGEMREILNQVIQASKEAEANLIRRREETAAARSQANTAKLLAENPILGRLKELEALKEILANTKATFVFGAGDIAGQVKSLIASEKD